MAWRGRGPGGEEARFADSGVKTRTKKPVQKLYGVAVAAAELEFTITH